MSVSAPLPPTETGPPPAGTDISASAASAIFAILLMAASKAAQGPASSHRPGQRTMTATPPGARQRSQERSACKGRCALVERGQGSVHEVWDLSVDHCSSTASLMTVG